LEAFKLLFWFSVAQAHMDSLKRPPFGHLGLIVRVDFHDIEVKRTVVIRHGKTASM
jgi:hypothetical protein